MIPYLIAVVLGIVLAYFASRAPELRPMRIAQFIFVPIGFVICEHGIQLVKVAGDEIAAVGALVVFLVGLIFVIALLAPNIGYYIGAGFTNLIDPQDWTPEEEDIALRPIRQLIDRNNFRQALGELDVLLQKHKPTYEAVLTRARLLHYIGRADETLASLPGLIPLSNSPAQQRAVMELLPFLDEQNPPPPEPAAPGVRTVDLDHELVVFAMTDDNPRPHKVVPPGSYRVEEILHDKRRWWRIAGDNWGNAALWWEALAASNRQKPTPAKKGFLRRIAAMQQAIGAKFKRKSHAQLLEESKQLFKEAHPFIQKGDWQNALPLLQKASACNPDNYEIAYRWAQAVRLTSGAAAANQTINRVLQQSQWTRNQQEMLEQLKQPGA